MLSTVFCSRAGIALLLAGKPAAVGIVCASKLLSRWHGFMFFIGFVLEWAGKPAAVVIIPTP